MKFLRTAPTGRLLASLAGLLVAIAAGTAIAVAATSSATKPKVQSLATALHEAVTARPVMGITADIQFTNNLIDSSDFTASDTVDPILQGTRTGRLWLSSDHQLRIELQSGNGQDAQVLVNKSSFWISDPASQTVYEGTLPAEKKDTPKSGESAGHGVPTVAEIQSDLNRLMRRVDLTGTTAASSAPTPSNVAGQPAYEVKISPKHDGGELGSVQLAWDAARGVPLDVGIYARGNNTTPVLGLTATGISYAPVASGKGSPFAIAPPAGYKVIRISSAQQSKLATGAAKHARAVKSAKKVAGVAAVAAEVPFLNAPKSLVGLPRRDVSLLSSGGQPGALVTYGQNLGGIVVIEQKADAGSTASTKATGSRDGLSLPTVSISPNVTGTELSTPLGTVIQFTRAGVSYTVLGSVPPTAAQPAAQGLPIVPTTR